MAVNEASAVYAEKRIVLARTSGLSSWLHQLSVPKRETQTQTLITLEFSFIGTHRYVLIHMSLLAWEIEDLCRPRTSACSVRFSDLSSGC